MGASVGAGVGEQLKHAEQSVHRHIASLPHQWCVSHHGRHFGLHSTHSEHAAYVHLLSHDWGLSSHQDGHGPGRASHLLQPLQFAHSHFFSHFAECFGHHWAHGAARAVQAQSSTRATTRI